jgi:hypothetical protein
MIAQVALITAAVIAFPSALLLAWIAACEITQARERRKHAREMAAASRAVHAAVGASHEAVEGGLPVKEDLLWDRIASRDEAWARRCLNDARANGR